MRISTRGFDECCTKVVKEDTSSSTKTIASKVNHILKWLQWLLGSKQRKTVHTFSAKSQAMILGVGQVHSHRFMFLEALDTTWPTSNGEAIAEIPCVAVTDSRSLFNCLSQRVCNRCLEWQDKRTKTDVAILKDDMKKTGGHTRWKEGIWSRTPTADISHFPFQDRKNSVKRTFRSIVCSIKFSDGNYYQ